MTNEPMKFPEPESSGEPSVEKDAINWATLTHLSSLTGFVTGGLGYVVGPLVMWLLRKDQWEFVDDQGKEALNFNITVFIAGIVSFILVFVLIGILLLVLVGLAQLVFTIVAAVNANKGVRYRYPLTIKFIK
jgi:uncharacterized Tic20 family protein